MFKTEPQMSCREHGQNCCAGQKSQTNVFSMTSANASVMLHVRYCDEAQVKTGTESILQNLKQINTAQPAQNDVLVFFREAWWESNTF